ncbi:uncharacterized protein FOMMEDRAFT_18532, partial [Fomitiporia mediterranea MF3/22]|uniref:uncharacterized protein n=1 Tax=Fomitiporia mediterranea (strain MF3/22) TaxID=694068 RepID=UPI00044075DF
MVVMDNKGEAEEPPILPAKESTEGPPSYDTATSAPQLPRTRSSSSASNSSRCDRINHSSHPKLPNIPTSNLVTIKRKNAYIKGTYVIDAALQIPIEVLTGEGTSATGAAAESIPVPRKNLYL